MKTRYKLILPLTFFIAALANVAFTNKSTGQNKSNHSDSDSIIMAHDIREAKIGHMGELRDTTLTNHQLDSVLAEYGMSIFSHKIYHTPDGALKIFLIETGMGGAYNNSDYTTFIHLKNGKLLHGGNHFCPIDTIYLLPDGKYLLLQGFSTRENAVCGDQIAIATVFEIVHDSVVLSPPVFTGGLSGDSLFISSRKIEFALGSQQDESDTAERYIQYYPKTLTLKYQHGSPCDSYNQEPKIYTGSFKYKNGTFIQDKETVTEIGVKEH